MRVVHTTEDEQFTLANTVDTADSFLSQARGLMFRRSIPDDYALAFRFDDERARDIHMLFVPFPLDVVWACDGVVRRVERLSSWTGFARAQADAIFELPAGSAVDVREGDTVQLTE